MMIHARNLQALKSGEKYYKKLIRLFGASIIGYWPLWESSGSTIANISGGSGNGAYIGSPSLNQTGIKDGRTSVLFNGTNQAANIYSAGLNGAINLQEGTLLVWIKVSAAADWSDATNRVLFHLGINSTNYIRVIKTAAANELQWAHRVGATNITRSKIDMRTTAWFRLGLTWSNSNDRLRAYLNGVQYSTDASGLGTLAGALGAGWCLVGAQTTTPLLPWKGSASHAMILNREATPAEMLAEYDLAPNWIPLSENMYISLPSNVYKGNFHSHSTVSDGADTPEAMVTGYRDAGYDFCALTDHNTINGIFFFPLVTDPGVSGITFWVGAESYCTDVGSGHVHLVCVNLTEQVTDMVTQDVLNSVPWAHIAHPLALDWGGITAAEIAALNNIYGVVVQETIGVGGDAFWDSVLTLGKQIYGIAEDDSHAVGEIGTRGWLMVYANSLTWANILASLQTGRFYGSQGPVLTITDNGRRLTIQTTTNCNFYFYKTDGAQVWSKASSQTATYPYFGDEGYLRCRVSDASTGKKAWTNAIMFG